MSNSLRAWLDEFVFQQARAALRNGMGSRDIGWNTAPVWDQEKAPAPHSVQITKIYKTRFGSTLASETERWKGGLFAEAHDKTRKVLIFFRKEVVNRWNTQHSVPLEQCQKWVVRLVSYRLQPCRKNALPQQYGGPSFFLEVATCKPMSPRVDEGYVFNRQASFIATVSDVSDGSDEDSGGDQQDANARARTVTRWISKSTQNASPSKKEDMSKWSKPRLPSPDTAARLKETALAPLGNRPPLFKSFPPQQPNSQLDRTRISSSPESQGTASDLAEVEDGLGILKVPEPGQRIVLEIQNGRPLPEPSSGSSGEKSQKVQDSGVNKSLQSGNSVLDPSWKTLGSEDFGEGIQNVEDPSASRIGPSEPSHSAASGIEPGTADPGTAVATVVEVEGADEDNSILEPRQEARLKPAAPFHSPGPNFYNRVVVSIPSPASPTKLANEAVHVSDLSASTSLQRQASTFPSQPSPSPRKQASTIPSQPSPLNVATSSAQDSGLKDRSLDRPHQSREPSPHRPAASRARTSVIRAGTPSRTTTGADFSLSSPESDDALNLPIDQAGLPLLAAQEPIAQATTIDDWLTAPLEEPDDHIALPLIKKSKRKVAETSASLDGEVATATKRQRVAESDDGRPEEFDEEQEPVRVPFVRETRRTQIAGAPDGHHTRLQSPFLKHTHADVQEQEQDDHVAPSKRMLKEYERKTSYGVPAPRPRVISVGAEHRHAGQSHLPAHVREPRETLSHAPSKRDPDERSREQSVLSTVSRSTKKRDFSSRELSRKQEREERRSRGSSVRSDYVKAESPRIASRSEHPRLSTSHATPKSAFSRPGPPDPSRDRSRLQQDRSAPPPDSVTYHPQRAGVFTDRRSVPKSDPSTLVRPTVRGHGVIPTAPTPSRPSPTDWKAKFRMSNNEAVRKELDAKLLEARGAHQHKRS